MPHLGMSPRVRRSLERATVLARVRNHHWVGCEHVMLALLEDSAGLPAELFERLEILEETRTALETYLDDAVMRWKAGGGGPSNPVASNLVDVKPTPRLRRCLSVASQMRRDGFTSEHVLLAFVEDESSVPAVVVEKIGARKHVIEEIKRLMASDSYYSEPCILVDANDAFVGWPERQEDGSFMIRRTTGKIDGWGDVL